MSGEMNLTPGSVILVTGHETSGSTELTELERAGMAGAKVTVARPGRELNSAIEGAWNVTDRDRPVVVLPMTVGRDPRLISDTARTVRWAMRDRPGQIALAPPFGTADHLVGWLRGACRRSSPVERSVLIAARPADPFDDAELYRIAALVRIQSGLKLVEVGIESAEGSLDDALSRCRMLGADRVTIIPAGLFGRPGQTESLLAPAAIRQVVTDRVAAALHLLAEHGESGVSAALESDHAHGFAHSHGEHDGASHSHGAGQSHPHQHHHEHKDSHSHRDVPSEVA